MDIPLSSLLYTAQNSGKRAFLGAWDSVWSKNLASAFSSWHFSGHTAWHIPHFKLPRDWWKIETPWHHAFSKAIRKSSLGDLQVVIPSHNGFLSHFTR